MDTDTMDHLKEALLHELDQALQRTYHQRLQEILTDLRIHYAPVSLHPRPDEVASLLVRHGVLQREGTAELREAFDRWERGLLGLCTRCGAEIAPDLLQSHPMQALCPRCSAAASR
jgi:RNA polymerase-binding transcription factor DksA